MQPRPTVINDRPIFGCKAKATCLLDFDDWFAQSMQDSQTTPALHPSEGHVDPEVDPVNADPWQVFGSQLFVELQETVARPP
ncbi:hypothetical protein [Burkholderia sp. JP2-270]|uniref:hypothetical protein n=1 Tax=Burkholderia sp. JP2-270 TaxID=2217913 RepID=UPI0013A6E909|nr:hypothetical protein [Burkholderia sp. JP2-270]